MSFLHKNNYTVIALSYAKRLLESDKKICGKYAVITFDDGYNDFHTDAFPVLRRYGFSATVFLPTEFISNKGLKLKGKEHLSWSEVRELQSNNIAFGSHTATHPQLKSLDRADVEHEIVYSKKTIEDKIGSTVDSFSYPYAFPEEDRKFTRYLKEVLQKSGYTYGVSTRIGTSSKKDDIFFMRRLPINSSDDARLLRAKLEGSYNWLHQVQYITKLIRSKVL